MDFNKSNFVDTLSPGITQPEKIDLIKNWPVPKTVEELKSFLGLVGFYQRFIPRYSSTIACLTQLYRKDVQFLWTDECQQAFGKIKDELANAVELAFPDVDKQFIVHLDASNLALGATLRQEASDGTLRLVNCTSRKFNDAEKKYPMHEKEQMALVHVLKVWKHYLLGAQYPILVYTDNIATRHILTSPATTLSPRQVRWLQLIEQFNVDLRHIKGTTNTAADTLSRLMPIVSSTTSCDPPQHSYNTRHVVPITRRRLADEEEPFEDIPEQEEINENHNDDWIHDYEDDEEI